MQGVEDPSRFVRCWGLSPLPDPLCTDLCTACPAPCRGWGTKPPCAAPGSRSAPGRSVHQYVHQVPCPVQGVGDPSCLLQHQGLGPLPDPPCTAPPPDCKQTNQRERGLVLSLVWLFPSLLGRGGASFSPCLSLLVGSAPPITLNLSGAGALGCHLLNHHSCYSAFSTLTTLAEPLPPSKQTLG